MRCTNSRRQLSIDTNPSLSSPTRRHSSVGVYGFVSLTATPCKCGYAQTESDKGNQSIVSATPRRNTAVHMKPKKTTAPRGGVQLRTTTARGATPPSSLSRVVNRRCMVPRDRMRRFHFATIPSRPPSTIVSSRLGYAELPTKRGTFPQGRLIIFRAVRGAATLRRAGK